MACSALTMHSCSAVQVLRSRDADLRHTISELQGLSSHSSRVFLYLCPKRALSSEVGTV